ncbi:hypothetical protein BCR15_01505 [Tessaracoccus lapidicaptus]|uniref:Uncharacterized protein n=1 Tax=Tessaracoccus lapidicaptus TaxID=1427523 RepID=A0A1C0AQF8_9ACTN|nr:MULTISPECIES: hypothetical protein [Tessaracoccus]OCL36567.1 hypothetical protein BCR15_01505 [Tessaracoccus lapidicaptus]VEP39332.1 hypothetical protein TLA_TLA_00744 [Tessaracoccus lapidicaptus]
MRVHRPKRRRQVDVHQNLLGLIHPTSGTATVFGKDITTSGLEIRQQVGYLPSEVFYYDDNVGAAIATTYRAFAARDLAV